MIEPTDDALRDWLLGRLPAADADALDQRVLGDDAFGARLAEIETDLLDDLVAGRLAGDEAAAALARFTATPRARWRLRVARALARFAPAREAHRTRGTLRRMPPRRLWLGAAVGAIAAVALVAIGLQRRAPTAEATITLLADRQRGAASGAFAVPRAAATVRLQVEVADASPTDHFTLDIADGTKIVFRREMLETRAAGPNRFVDARVPREALTPGERRVTVRAAGAATDAASASLTIRAE